MTLEQQQNEALETVRRSLLDGARADAQAVLAAADEEAESVLAAARHEADRILEAARARAEADVSVVVAGERSRARRRAREIVLGAQRDAFEELCRRTCAAVADLMASAGYGEATRAAFGARALALLGPGASVHDGAGATVVAERDGRRVVLSAKDLADRAVASLGDAVTGLWTP